MPLTTVAVGHASDCSPGRSTLYSRQAAAQAHLDGIGDEAGHLCRGGGLAGELAELARRGNLVQLLEGALAPLLLPTHQPSRHRLSARQERLAARTNTPTLCL